MRARLGLGFGFILFLLLTVAAFGSLQMKNLNDDKQYLPAVTPAEVIRTPSRQKIRSGSTRAAGKRQTSDARRIHDQGDSQRQMAGRE